MRKIYPQFMWGFQSQDFLNIQTLSRDLVALSDDEATMSNFFSSYFNVSHPSLEVSLLQGALIKFSLRCVIYIGREMGGGGG